MFSNYFLVLLLSHLAGDFVFQNDWLCKMKTDSDIKQRVRGVSLHVVIIFLINISIFLIFIPGEIPWRVLFFINIFHWLLDMVKSKIQSKKKIYEIESVMTSKIPNSSAEKTSIKEVSSFDSDQTSTSKRKQEYEKEKVNEKISEIITSTGHMESKTKTNKWAICLFFGDQVLHLISIFIAANALYRFDVNHYMSFCYQFVSGTVTVSTSLNLMKKVLLFLIYLCLATSVSNVVVKLFLGEFRKDLGADVKTGRYIGGVERILTISIILVGAWQALTVLYGSKTAIRFDQAKGNPDFAEYYILGTTLSALFAVIIAVAVKITLL